jgi:uncharacterized protein (TIGR00369 family)
LAMTDASDIGSDETQGEEIVSYSHCFVCGMDNPSGLRVRFFQAGDGEAVATCEPDSVFAGYHGLLHGGVASTLLDEIMIKAVLAQSRLAVTARMTVNYHKPVPLGTKLTLRGRICRRRGRIFETEGWLADPGGTRLVSAAGTYVVVTGKQKAALEQSLDG